MKKEHRRKLIAPVVITAGIVLYFIGLMIGVLCNQTALSTGLIIIGVVLPLCLAAVIVRLLMERIKEIRSGEEDDLSQY